MLPEGWTTHRIGDLIKLGSGDARPRETVPIPNDANSIPVYGGNGILGYSSQSNSDFDDIVIGRVGEYCGVTRFVSGKKWITDNALYTKEVASKVSIKYLAVALQAFDLSRLKSKGGQPLVSQQPIYSQIFNVPEFQEQKRIVLILSTWDRAIAVQEQLVANARAQKKALMQTLLTGKKRLPGFKGEWKKVRLGQLGEFRKGSGILRDQVLEVGFPCIRYGEIYTTHHDQIREFASFIDSKSALEAERLVTGDLLFTCSGETAEEIGKCVAYLGSCEAYAGGDIILLNPTGHNSLYMSYVLNGANVVEQKRKFGQGNSVVHISAANLAKLFFKIPARSEQDAIATTIDSASDLIRRGEDDLAKMKLQKSALMQQLLTGKRRVKVEALDTKLENQIREATKMVGGVTE